MLIHTKEPSCSSELIFSVALQDLEVDEENISINLEGQIYRVNCLEKQGTQWVAHLSPSGNCSWGHPLCPPSGSGQCHTRICPLYQPRTSRCR